MANVYQAIKNSVIRQLKALYPDMDVTSEEIAKTDYEDDELDIEDYIFIEIIPVGSQTLGMTMTHRTVMVTLTAHTASESNVGYLQMAEDIDSALRPVLRFEERAITIENSSFRIVDRLLSYTFTLRFYDGVPEDETLPYIGELELSRTERL